MMEGDTVIGAEQLSRYRLGEACKALVTNSFLAGGNHETIVGVIDHTIHKLVMLEVLDLWR